MKLQQENLYCLLPACFTVRCSRTISPHSVVRWTELRACREASRFAPAFWCHWESCVDTSLLILAMIVVVLVLVGAIMLKKDHED